MSEHELRDLMFRLNSLDAKVGEIYQILVGEHGGLSEKPGLIALCRMHRQKYHDAETRLQKIELEVSELTRYKAKVAAWCALGFVLVTVGWEVAKVTVLK